MDIKAEEQIYKQNKGVLLAQLEIDDLDIILRGKRLRLFGHVERSSGAIKTACVIQIDGKHGPGQSTFVMEDIDRKRLS